MSGDKSISNEMLEEIISDCFWGDYNYSAEDINRELSSGNERFRLLLFSKILNNSRYPSKYIRALFTEDEVRSCLLNMPEHLNERSFLRRQLIKANVLGDNIEIKGLKWRKR